MGNVKGTNNLRDFYYRDIVLGEQNEQVYNHTNNFEIALAFSQIFDKELEKGYADMKASHTTSAKSTFENIRKNYNL